MWPGEPFGAKVVSDERSKIDISHFVNTNVVKTLEEFPKFLEGGHIFGFFMVKIAQSRTLDVSV